MASTTVTTAQELAAALDSGALEIDVEGVITGSPMITLPPGATLRGGTLRFGAKGVRLTSDNTLDGVTILTEPDEVAILNDTSVPDLGRLTLRGVTTRGQVYLVAEDAVRAGHVQIEGLTIETADVRGRPLRPHGFGVEALQGALTVWNRQPEPVVTITAEVLDVAVGTREAPVRGSGVFVGGHGDWAGKADGGVLSVGELRTREIHTHGGIPEGTPDLISGGVFVISGATVDSVVTAGPVTTYGQNDMVLDNWGIVRVWTAHAPVTSNGPSGIGFVNFGDIDLLEVTDTIRTTGRGARGFNLYDGSLRDARFASIETTGDGSVGIQISKPLGSLAVSGDVTTSGGEGTSLVKGVQMPLKAVALSVKAGAEIGSIAIGGRLATMGSGVTTLEVEGSVVSLEVAGGIHAHGKGSDAVHLGDGAPDLAGIEVTADSGEPIVRI
ncbi:hypothetical protein [Sinomonas atrocyanea]|uniref:hypothetical protein n=1 Tax=Sinomonas atrocyanea TaxID=37927 RepID=UPI00278431F3|nr:hypothetical protein [Sinomonas atrocyanea]MDQ0261786.1 hypothetical protein [Sinomonas atrocyanea]MDR6623381.1 hypothetical protein [Sinomonas atrocyanea]